VKSTLEPPPVEAEESRPTQGGTRYDPTPAVLQLQRGPAGRREKHRTVEVLQASCFFLRLSPDEKHLLIRAMLGGAVDEAARDLDEDAMVALVRTDLVRLFGLRAEPAFVQVTKWDRAVRQYELGHLYKRWRRWRRRLPPGRVSSWRETRSSTLELIRSIEVGPVAFPGVDAAPASDYDAVKE
jgi:hypothetical protein